MREANKKVKKDVDDIAAKLNEFNIYDMFQGGGQDGGSSDAGVMLTQNLEKKT